MNNYLQNKLLQYKITPPESVWDNINSALDEELTGTDKLYNFEQQPSSLIWKKLTSQLDADSLSGNKTTPFFKLYQKPLRYISAAAIIAIVAITITLLVNKSALTNELVYHPAVKENDPEPLKIKENIPENNVDKKSNGQNLATIPNDADAQSSHSNSFIKNSRYLTVANQKGNSVRLSQKALRVFNCAENIAAVNNSRCKENIQSLQQKMATSLVSPSGDFAGLIDMIKRLEENL